MLDSRYFFDVPSGRLPGNFFRSRGRIASLMRSIIGGDGLAIRFTIAWSSRRRAD